MAHNKLYRNFIILQEDERGYSSSKDKALSGYAKIEVKGDKCKVSFYAQNLKQEDNYSMVLICCKRDFKQLIDLGPLAINEVGKGDTSKEYYINNIAGIGISYEKISGAAICKTKGGENAFIMHGFMNGEESAENWRKFKMTKVDSKKNNNKLDLEFKIKEKSNTNLDASDKSIILESNQDAIKSEKITKIETKVADKIENKLQSKVNIKTEHLNDDISNTHDKIKELQDIKVKINDEINELQDVEVKRSAEVKELQDVEVKRIDEINELQDVEVKRSAEVKELQDVEVKRIDEVKELQDIEAKRIDDVKELQDIEVKRSDEVKKLQDIEVKKSDETKELQDVEVKRSYEASKEVNENIKVEETINELDQDRNKCSKSIKHEKDHKKECLGEVIKEIADKLETYEGTINLEIKDSNKDVVIYGFIKGKKDDDCKWKKFKLEKKCSEDNESMILDKSSKKMKENITLDEIDFEGYENEIDKLNLEDDFKINGKAGQYFEKLAEGFEPYKEKLTDINYCKWYKVNVGSMEDLSDESNYNKYTLAYYPMLNYYPYISKDKHFLLGYKCDQTGELKYIVYAIPGSKDKSEQPYGGKTGFVTWTSNNTGNKGYWLMFYDYKSSSIAVPTK